MSEYTLFSDAQIGMILSRPVLISGISEATAKNGKTFLKISMKDGKTEQTATMFGTTSEELTKNTGVVTGSIAEVELQVSEYQGSKSFTVNHIAFCMNPNVSIDDFIKVPPVSVTAMYNEICSIIKESAADNNGTSIAALPIYEWNGAHNGTIHLHGHIHSTGSYNTANLQKKYIDRFPEKSFMKDSTLGLRIYDIGVDANNYRPISITQIAELMNLRSIKEELT